jgi:hypothetical protein
MREGLCSGFSLGAGGGWMKGVTGAIGLALVVVSFGGARQQQADDTESCGFLVQNELSHVTVTGPDDIVPLVYVVKQPDSPLEIVSANFDGTWLSVSGGRYSEKTCTTYEIRNRSDRTIYGFETEILINHVPTGGMLIGRNPPPLQPGQTVEHKECNEHGTGDAPGNHVRFLVAVTRIDFGDCFYYPSARIPRGVIPYW